MQASNRRNDQTAHISLQYTKFSKSMKSKTQHRANPLARRQAATPTSFPLGPPPRPFQSSNLRFGEAVSRPTNQNPQEKKCRSGAFSSSTCHETLVSLVLHENRAGRKLRRRPHPAGRSGKCANFHQNHAPFPAMRRMAGFAVLAFGPLPYGIGPPIWSLR